MNLKLFFSVVLCCLSGSAFAQVTDSSAWWTFMRGNMPAGIRYGVYGTKGISAPANTPGSRMYSGVWKGTGDTVYVFGGNGFAAQGAGRYLLDMWRYDMSTNEWTWLHGPDSVERYGIYGTQGTPGVINRPGARMAFANWKDKDGNLWVFGGMGFGASTGGFNTTAVNDMWKYNPSTNEWTWMHGSTATNQNGVYGTQGVADPANRPGSRGQCASWVDKDGNFWMFAGLGYHETGGAVTGTITVLNDLWKYDPDPSSPTYNQWTWMGGNKTANGLATYGTPTVEAPGNIPGARRILHTWTDDAGNLWMFGGVGYNNSASGYLDELWKYNPATGRWTFMKGSTTLNSAGVYGTRGAPAAANYPGARYTVVSWKEVGSNNIWLYAGYGKGMSGNNHYQGDIWRYNMSTNQWTWMKGPDGTGAATESNAAYVTGTALIPAQGNTPGGRQGNISWTDDAGNFWLFAGAISPGMYNDVWKLAPVVTGPAQPGLYTAAPSPVCQGASNVTYTVPAVSGATSYEWVYSGTGVTFSGGASTTQPTNNLTFSGSATGGTLSVRAVNSNGNSPYRDTVITVNTAPATPGAFTAAPATVCQGQSNVTYTVPNVAGITYNWSYTGGTGATINGSGNSVTVSFNTSATSGTLQVTATNSCGTSTARTTNITVNPLPATPGAFTAGPATVCQGQSNVTYTVPNVAGVTYTWSYTGGTGATINGSGNSVTVNFSTSATSGTLQVTATNSCGTSTARSIGVTVHPLPVATVSPAGPVDICEDDSVTLTAGTGTGYTYQWKNGTANVGAGGNTYDASTTGNYKVVVTDGGTGCKDSTQEVSVTVYNRPSGILIPGDTSFCEGGVVTLSVSTTDTGLDYRWKNGAATIPLATAYFLEINETGVYTVVLNRTLIPGGCADTTPPVTVMVYPLPGPVVIWDGQTFYAGGGYAGYQWSTGSQAIAGATDSTFRPSLNGSYSVTVTDSNGCSNTSAAQLITLGIGDMTAAEQVRIYPNPSDGIVHILAPVSVNVSLCSMDGRILLQQADVKAIDISGYAEGIYMLQITGTDGTVIRTERIFRQSRQ